MNYIRNQVESYPKNFNFFCAQCLKDITNVDILRISYENNRYLEITMPFKMFMFTLKFSAWF